MLEMAAATEQRACKPECVRVRARTCFCECMRHVPSGQARSTGDRRERKVLATTAAGTLASSVMSVRSTHASPTSRRSRSRSSTRRRDVRAPARLGGARSRRKRLCATGNSRRVPRQRVSNHFEERVTLNLFSNHSNTLFDVLNQTNSEEVDFQMLF